MKTIIKISIVVIAIMICAGALFAVSPNLFCAIGASGNADKLIEKIMPYASAVASGLVLIIVAVMPTAKKLLEISKSLSASDKNLQNVLDENELLKSELKMLINEIKKINKNIEKTRKMTQIGFCNMRELVENGFARNIAEIDNEDEDN